MNKFFRLALSDIKKRQNIELYLTLAVAIIVLIADIIGVKDDNILFNVVLAALAVIIFKAIQDSHERERVENKLDALLASSKPSFLHRWDNDAFRKHLPSAREICGVFSLGNYEFLHTNLSELRRLIENGGQLKFVFANPDSKAFEIAVHRYFGNTDNENVKKAQLRLQLAVQTLKELSKSAPVNNVVEIKLTNELPTSSVLLLNYQTDAGVIFVTLHDYHSSSMPSPSFILDRSDEQWFNTYVSVFENFWSKLTDDMAFP